MAFRWRQGDTQAFDAVMKMGEKAREMYEKSQAGKAYTEGSKVQTFDTTAPATKEQVDRANVENALQSAEDAKYFKMGPEEAAKYAPLQVNEGSATTGSKRYGLGNSTERRSAPYTPDEQATGGLNSMQQYYLAKGDPEKALEMGLKSRQLSMLGKQEKLTDAEIANTEPKKKLLQQQVDAGDYLASSRARVAAIQKDWADNGPRKLLAQYNTDQGRFGVGPDAGKRGNAVARSDGTGYDIYQIDKDGKQVGNSIFKNTADIQREAQHSMLADLAVADPEKYLGAAITAGHSAATLQATLKQYAETERHNIAVEGLTGDRLKMETKKLDIYIKKLDATLGRAGKGQMSDVTWIDDKGNAKTGKVGFEMVGRKLVVYDLATGGELPANDPRAKALIAGDPKNTKGNNTLDPIRANISVKIKNGTAEEKDFAVLKALNAQELAANEFGADEKLDRFSAVVKFIRNSRNYGAETRDQEMALAKSLGITNEEMQNARAFERTPNIGAPLSRSLPARSISYPPVDVDPINYDANPAY